MPKAEVDSAPARRSSRIASRAPVAKPEVKTPAPKKAAAPKKAEAKAEDKPAEKKTSAKDSKKDSAKDSKKASSKADKAEDKAEVAESETLALGDKLPSITLQDNTGADVDVSTLAGEKGVVFFLYPKADTPGCTIQACGYRDTYQEIADQGYEVYGLSKDAPTAQQKWKNKKELTYKLLSDPQSKLIKALGAFVLPNNTKRSHFIFEKGTGKLIDIALGVKPADDPTKTLQFIKKHHA